MKNNFETVDDRQKLEYKELQDLKKKFMSIILINEVS